MTRSTPRLLRPRSGRGLAILFALTILLPGGLLAVFGVRAWFQEQRSVAHEIRERLEREADGAGRDLERAIGEWTTALARLDASGAFDRSRLPEILRPSLDEPGAAAVVTFGAGRSDLWPESQRLYAASETDGDRAPNANESLADAEALEFRKDYQRAIDAYQRMLASTTQAEPRAVVLHRLARTYRKAGREEDALRAFGDLAPLSVRVGSVPAELIAGFGACAHWVDPLVADRLAGCALDLYGSLVTGRWGLERVRHAYYSQTVRDWLDLTAAPRDQVASFAALEEAKRALTAAVDEVLADAATISMRASGAGAPPLQTATHLAFAHAAGGRGAALVVSRTWLAARAWPSTFTATLSAGFDVVLLAADEPLFDSARAAGQVTSTNIPTATRGLAGSIPSWRIRISPRDPTALMAAATRRQRVYLVMLVLVVFLLGSGTYLTLSVMRHELEIARLKSDFVATVSHEFRSPLTGIRQLGEMLMRGRVPSEERRQEYHERITRESDRLSRLVENLLDFARMEEGRKQYRFATLETATWLRATARDVQGQFAGVKTIETTIPADLPAIVGDREALTCAVQNLVDNAVKYSPGRDTVWMEAEAWDQGFALRVRDAGVGISRPDRRRIFEKFYRGDGDITQQVKGAGLGLSLVSHIVGAHGGRIECESQVGEGTTFTLWLPSAAHHTLAASDLSPGRRGA